MADATDVVRALSHEDRLGPLRVGVLGPLTVHDDSGPIHVAGIHRRRLLAFLASRPGRVVSVDAIIDALWGDDPPPTAAKTLQSHVVRLRRSLTDSHADLIETVPGGYRLAIEPQSVDAERFERQVIDARASVAAGDHATAAVTLSEALDMWRGPAYLEFIAWDFAAGEAVRLDELCLTVREELAAAQIASGAAIAAVVGLERLVHDAPGREHAWRLLMDAMAITGRQHDALGAYQRARRALGEFGLQPAQELQEAERRIIGSDAQPAAPAGPTILAAALRTSSALIGRDHERAALHAAWLSAKTGAGQVRVLAGPLESGRTRLAADLAGRVLADGGAVEYARGSDVERLATRGQRPTSSVGEIVDFVAERCRRGPLLLIVDDAEWAGEAAIETIRALVAAADQLALMLLLVLDGTGGGPAVVAIERFDPSQSVTVVLEPMPPDQLAAVIVADGVEAGAIAGIVAMSNGLPGVARREAAAWAERTAAIRLQAAATSSIGAITEAHRAQASVLDEVVELVAVRARRDELWSARWAGRQPYRALTAYGPQDAELFVGRERLVAELAARVLETRLVIVVGASGSGKSSLARAGLVPLARSGRLPGGQPWTTHVIVPGFDPLAALEGLEDIDQVGPQLLLVDQFEEVFAAAPAIIARFTQQLVELSGDPGLDVHVVLVVRSDEFGRLTSTELLSDAVVHSQVIVGPPTEDEFRRIVIEPARRTGVGVEPALVDLVVHEVGNHDAALPLVSATLAEIWERRDSGALSAATYVEVGGLASAVQRLGDQAIERVGVTNVGELRSVMLALADVTDEGTWTRRRVAVEELAGRARSVDALVEARLVVRDDQTVEVAHEAVFRAWPELVRWLDEARADMVLERDVGAASRTWDAQGRVDDNLYRGARLHAAREWADRQTDEPSITVVDFLNAGRELEEREQQIVRAQLARERRARRRLSWALTVAAVLLTLAVIAGAVAVISRGRAQDAAALAVARQADADAAAALAAQRQSDAEAAREQADDARDQADQAATLAAQRQAQAESAERATAAESDRARNARLVAESGRQIDTQLDRALLLAVEARRRDDSIAARGALLTALSANVTSETMEPASDTVGTVIHRTNSAFLGFLSGPPRELFAVGLSADGGIVVAAGRNEDGTAGLAVAYDASTRLPIGRIETPARITDAVVSGDGRYVVAADFTELHRLDVETGEDLVRHGDFGPLMLEPDGKRVVVLNGTPDHYAVWDVATLTPVTEPTLLPEPGMRSAGFANDGSLVVISADENLAVYVEVGSGAELRRVDLEPAPAMIVFYSMSADGSTLAGSQPTGQVYLWDLATGKLRGTPNDRAGTVWGIAFHPNDPNQLAISQMGGGVMLHDIGRDRPLGDRLVVSSSPTRAVGFSADGRFLATGADNGLVGIWGYNDQDSLISHRIAIDLVRPTMSSNGATTVYWSDRTRRFEIANDRASTPTVAVHRPDDTPITTVESPMHLVSADGSTILTFDEARNALVAADGSTGAIFWSLDASDPVMRYTGAVSPDGRIVAVSDPTTIFLWDVRAGVQLADLPLADLSTSEQTAPASFSLDGGHIYVPFGTEVVRLAIASFEPDLRFSAPDAVITQVLEVPRSGRAVAGALGGILVGWDASSGEVVAVGRTSGAALAYGTSVSPNGELLAIDRAQRAEVELFDTATLHPLGEPIPVGDLTFVPSFTADSRALLGDGFFNDATRWELDPDVWQETACFAAGRNLTQEEWLEYIGSEEAYRRTCDEWPAG